MREFSTGANRDSDEGKLPYARALSPAVLKRYVEYMLKHNTTEDGSRAPDNWKRGIPTSAYMDSMFRHFAEVWDLDTEQRGMQEEMQEALCALLFNVMGYLHVNLDANNDICVRLAKSSIRAHQEQVAQDYEHGGTIAQQVADNAKRKHGGKRHGSKD